MNIDELKSKHFITQTVSNKDIKDLAQFITQPEIYAQFKDMMNQKVPEDKETIAADEQNEQFYPISKHTTPELFQICIDQGWTTNNEYMTAEELEKITSIQDVDFSGLEEFNEFKYFIGVTTIKAGAFSGCTKLKSISLPQNLTYIGKEAFKGCVNLSNIYCNNLIAPTIVKSSFIDVGKNMTSKKLYYPKNSSGYDKWDILITNNGFVVEKY